MTDAVRSPGQRLPTQEDHFDSIASQYEHTIPEPVMAHLVRRRVEIISSLRPQGRVLDVGCGTGRLMQALTEANYECAGADVSEEMLQLARRRGLQVRHGSADALPFDSESFDLAVSVATFHHLISPVVVAGAIREMARVLRPGGALLIWDHNPLNPYWRVLMARLPQDQGDERLVPARELTVGLAAAGLAEIRLQRITFMPDFTPAWGVPAVAASERLLERIPGIGLFAAHNVATANKPGAVHA